jgi:hypothetical protein
MFSKVVDWIYSTIANFPINRKFIFGKPEEIFKVIGVEQDDYPGASYVEILNFAIRTSLYKTPKKGMNFSKNMKIHQRALDFFQAWYNFIKLHESLNEKIDSDKGKWFQKTPAMAEKSTDHIWSLKELLIPLSVVKFHIS